MVQRLHLWSLETAWAELYTALAMILWGALGMLFPSASTDAALGGIFRFITPTQLELTTLAAGLFQFGAVQIGGRTVRAIGACATCFTAAFIIYYGMLNGHWPTRAASFFTTAMVLNLFAIARNVQFART